MLGRGRPYDDVHRFWSEQYEYTLQYAGYHTEWDDLAVRGSLEDGAFTAFYLKEGRVQAIDAGDEVTRAIPLIAAGAPVDRAKLADPDLDLAALA